MKRTPLQRRTPLSPGSKGLKRGRVKPRNAKRRTSEFARTYGSRERVAFVKSLDCMGCLEWRDIDNAHLETDGMGRKASYLRVVPLCRRCHRAYDERRPPFDQAYHRQQLAALAEYVERLWQSHNSRDEAAA